MLANDVSDVVNGQSFYGARKLFQNHEFLYHEFKTMNFLQSLYF